MSYHDPVDRNRRNPADAVPPTRAYPQPPHPGDAGYERDSGRYGDVGSPYDERTHGGPVYRDQEYYAPNQYDNPRDYQTSRPYGQQYGAPQQYGQPYGAPPPYDQQLPYDQQSQYGRPSQYDRPSQYEQPQARPGSRDDRTPRGAYEAPSRQASTRERKQAGPDVNPRWFVGGVVTTGIVTGLAAWLAAWIARIIVEKVNDSGKLGVWNPVSRDEYWFAVVAFLCAITAGALWYVLQLVTPSPNAFFRWIVMLLIVAAVLIPLLLSKEISVGIATAILHLIIGLPILALVPTMGQKSIESRR